MQIQLTVNYRKFNMSVLVLHLSFIFMNIHEIMCLEEMCATGHFTGSPSLQFIDIPVAENSSLVSISLRVWIQKSVVKDQKSYLNEFTICVE